MDNKKTAYGRFAKVYDLLSLIYSLGGISRVKKIQSSSIQRGERVLFAGAGGGEDVLFAAEKGAFVVVVELSTEMIEQAKIKVSTSKLDLNVEFICDDIMNYKRSEGLDKIYCNFFLNVFPEEFVPTVINHLLGSLKESGEFIVGDFACTKKHFIQHNFQKIYFGIAALFFVLTAKNPIHKLYDYESICEPLNLKLSNIDFIKILNFSAFSSLTFKKK